MSMTIKPWKHPIRYLRLVTTPTCVTCRHYVSGATCNCTCEKYLEHVNRLEGESYKRASIDLVRGTYWCRFEPIEEDADDQQR